MKNYTEAEKKQRQIEAQELRRVRKVLKEAKR